MKLILPVVLVFAALLSGCTPATKKIVFAVDPHWPPMEFLDEAKELQGYDVDLAKAVAQEAGYSAELRPVAWENLFGGLEAGSYDVIVSSVLITNLRKSKYDFSEPYLNAGQVLVVLRGSPLTGLADLKGKPVGALLGSPGADVIAKAGKLAPLLKTYNSSDLAFQDLAVGKISGVVTNIPTAAQYTVKNRRFKDIFHTVGAPLTEEKFGFVVAKGHPDLVNAINSALDRIKTSGLLDDLSARWLQ